MTVMLKEKLEVIGINTGAECKKKECLDLDGDGIVGSDYTYDYEDDMNQDELDGSAEEFQNIVGAIAFFAQMLGSVYDISTINALWVSANYFDSGLCAGKAALGLAFQSIRLVQYSVEGVPYYS